VFSNELLDAMPVHRVAMAGGELREVFVWWDGGRFVEELREPSTADIPEYFDGLGMRPGEGCRAEVTLEAVRWMRDAGGGLEHGFILTLDYGYEAEQMFAPWRTDGTLLCFYRHNPGNDPYARIGRQDMTAHVDFTSVRRAGEKAGLTTLGLTSQSEFLERLGIMEALSPPQPGKTDMEEYMARRGAVMELLDPAGLGRIRVLVQAKGLGSVRLIGLG
jgi:SAM-dependent MidA family methyltransferase